MFSVFIVVVNLMSLGLVECERFSGDLADQIIDIIDLFQ